MSILNGNFTKNKKPVNSGQHIYDPNFNSDLNVEYKTSEYFPNWAFNKINNPNSSIVIANGNSAFGTTLPPSYGGSNQCLVVQQSYDKTKDDPKKPPILKIKNTVSFGPGKYVLSFSAKYRADTNQSLSVSISNSSSVALVDTPVTDVKNSWTQKTYNFTIETGTSYDLMLTVTNTGLSSDISIFLTDFEFTFVDFLPVVSSQIKEVAPTTNPLQFSAAPTTNPLQFSAAPTTSVVAAAQQSLFVNELSSLIHPAAVAIKEINSTSTLKQGFTSSSDIQTTQPRNNPISDYYNFRPKLN